MKMAVWDLDGTVIDSSHRYRNLSDGKTIDLPFWQAMATPENVAKDRLLPLAVQYKADIANPLCFVVIATARVLGAADWMYIKKHLGLPDYTISRGHNDNRPDSWLKTAGLHALFACSPFRADDAIFYDDNKHNIVAVAALGIRCIQC